MKGVEDVHEVARVRCRPGGDDGEVHDRALRVYRAELEASQRALLNAWEMPYTAVLKQVDAHKRFEKKVRQKIACARSRLRRSSGRCMLQRLSPRETSNVGKAWPDVHYGMWGCAFMLDPRECERLPPKCSAPERYARCEDGTPAVESGAFKGL